MTEQRAVHLKKTNRSRMKHWFDEAFHRRTATQLAALDARFSATRFLDHALAGLEDRELLSRLNRTAEAFHIALPVSFPEQLSVLQAHAPQIGHNFTAIWPCAHVAAHGLDQPELSLTALKELTPHGSAEFALRPFLQRDPVGTLAVLAGWAASPNEHVRRLASEGSRPRLPWGIRLHSLVKDPSPTLPILCLLRADPSLYVRKSVANHLNDISKDHPEVVLDVAASWDLTCGHTAWIVRHALRTLVKRGHPRALELLGAGVAPQLDARFTATPGRVPIGATVTFGATLTSNASRSQSLVIDYVVHYVRSAGKSFPKVFKWKRLDLAQGETVTLIKRQTFRDFSTRRHLPGLHRVELQINGRRLAESAFTLSA
jgi:3-methyladenine DNA glycosylase AlkC